ncbi:sigma-70 family RNA polymerase sigma factor [Paracoccus sp. XHP0099]|uniref:Sigma-70 family RNA polymerase sigma factor n=2 Tax=Paracoccus marinaquae TaxID=2841926 RepID=A0ABS6ADX8_9RHOB|nr:sigma-70 family RNA polymerase sigma factor [Paracoccus marinaquae]
MAKDGNPDGAPLERTLRIGRGAFLGFLMKRLGNRADAEDVLQDFCIRVLARKDQLRDAERMDAWLYAVLRSALNDHYRKAGRSRRLNDAVALEMQSAELAEEPVEGRVVICHCVKGLVGGLRPADADLIRSIDIDEDDRATVAADLGVKPGALNVRLHRARTALSEALLAHCGPCCRHGFDDCSCPPAGCEHPVDETDCADELSAG